jgi:hypothetical protein
LKIDFVFRSPLNPPLIRGISEQFLTPTHLERKDKYPKGEN